MTIIGIDLGTTFSAASVVRDGKPHIIPINGQNIMPSVVGLSPDGQWLVGTPALNQWTLHPDRTVRSIKRKMGTDEMTVIGGESYTPQQISAIILTAIKQAAQEYLNEPVEKAVITVPAYFTDAQRRATREAGEIAGLDVVRIINEPTAASLAYGIRGEADATMLVYDLGGGTFDVSLVEMSGGVVDVRASHGNTRLGGDDFDEKLAEWLIEQFETKHGVDLRSQAQAFARVQRAAEQAKIALSSQPFTWVREEYLAEKDGLPLHMEIEVPRTTFEFLVNDLLHNTLHSVNRVMDDGGVDDPDHVLLVGGSTYIPAVRDLIMEHVEITPRTDVNPSEAVALGAGIQAAIIAGEPIDVILVDVTPFSLGIAVAEQTFVGFVGDRFKILIPRNSTIPTTVKEIFSAVQVNQKSASIEVYQGESAIASENTLLGEFMFNNLTQEAPGMPPRVTVEFDLDINGILKVQATDRASNRAAGITVQAANRRMTQSEIESARLSLPSASFGSSLPAELVREADVMLTRARHHAGDTDMQELIAAIEEMLDVQDEDALRDLLDDLSDALFELEEDDE